MDSVRRWSVLFAVLVWAMPAASVHYFKGLNTIADIEALQLVRDGVVTKPVLLAFSNPQCYLDVILPLGFPREFFDIADACMEIGQVQLKEEANELTTFFGVEACDTFVYLTPGKPLSDFEKLTPRNPEELSTFFWSRHHYRDFEISHDLPDPGRVDVFWEERFVMEERPVMTLAQGEKASIDTFRGHVFVFRDAQTRQLLARKVVTGPEGLRLSDMVNSVCGAEDDNCERPGSETLQLNDRSAEVWIGRTKSNVGRLVQNEQQPPAMPNYAPVGFKKLKVPEAVWAHIQDFLSKHKEHRITEAWEEDDTHVNFWEVPSTVTHVGSPMKIKIYQGLKPVLEEWSGIKLDPTSCYGIRQYYNGSWLRDHVDIGETHIISAILNVGQDVDRDWPLMILDHDGDRHMITMAPGDMVLYESATKIHGRPQPLLGREYSNIFVHFRPLEWASAAPEFTDGIMVQAAE